MTLAIFDLDNTLLAGDSDHAWGEFLVDAELVDPESHRKQNDQFYQDYLNGELDVMRYQRFALAPLIGHDMQKLDAWREAFMASRARPMYQQKASDLLDHHRRRGHILMIITATNRFVTGPIAEELGIEHLIATEPELCDGYYTGEVSGVPSFQEGKVLRLREWLKDHQETLEGAWFYSDSHNDLPLLRLVDHPVAVDPDPTLEARARENGWPVISLRD
ncbi:HAD-superfamily subfamily IB hydrolase, TIGR01490 [Marinobacter daqiaonensis]|uniref:Histidinol-phosphatase n=1 Tax=Marinobacter daqiaonensis TaxID=650891 RepID=A0A1I6K2Y7_9GAMM|nr:HAD family hydrolase [Marinobacter daqiaonensis]SFR85589.1 HAD-superfamily subfamily IB hydrolase, TIGR01490 [Marinobacter daqiaonensis]